MPDETEMRTRLDRLTARARLVVAFERLWPALVLGGSVLALFVALSWLDLWSVVPAPLRALGVVALAAGLLFAALLAWRAVRVPRAAVLDRLDRDSGAPHRPISSRQDRLADPDPDPFTQALWAAHRRRLDEAASRIRLKPPAPRLADRDPYALRAAVLLALVLAAFVAGPDKLGRLAAAFDWRGAATPAAGFRLDAWVDPPAYTGRAPVLLAGPNVAASPGGAPAVAAPAKSVVVVRAAGAGAVEVAAEGGLKPVEADSGSRPAARDAKTPAKAPVETGLVERRFALDRDGTLTVTRDGVGIARFDLHAVADLPPTVAVTGTPKSNLRGSLTLGYKIDDDYGVVGAEAAFSGPVLHGKPVTGRSLVEPPKMPLVLPSGARGLGAGKTTADLSDHPWAGAEVTAVLSARDEGGNVGVSAPVTLTLPARPFTKPLARALVEQRRDLVLDPDHRDRVATALDALAFAPEVFNPPPAVFLGLAAARTRLAAARADADLIGVADLLWSMALTIEDGDLGQTERDLRALQRQLRDAIARNAPPEEIKALTEALKQQLDKLLAEMARKDGAAPQDRGPAPRSKTVTPQDLQRLLDKMEQSARNGDMAQAQSLLDQLQNILENLRSARGGADGQTGKMNQSMSALERMMRDQQGLRDKTFNRGNQQRRAQGGQPDDDDAPGEDPQAGAPQQGDDQAGGENGDLRDQQRALRQQLGRLQTQMREMGLDGQKGFDEAEQAMKEAENALGKGAKGSDQAVEAQGRALQGLQQGARGLQGQMAQGNGEQGGQTGMGRADGTGEQTGTDPLGRERNGRLDAQHGLDAGEGLAERARQVLEELRRRLGDRLRPQDEQDYLERLLKRY